MILYGVIIGLIILCGSLIYERIKREKDLQEVVNALQGVKQGDGHKLFVKGTGAIAEIGYEINEIIEVYGEQVRGLERQERLHKQLLASLSHDVRTPLASLLGYLDALDEHIVEGEEEAQYIHIARDKAYSLKDFVDLLFDWFKLSAKEQLFHFETIEINEYTREILAGWYPTFEQQKIQVKAEIVEDEWYLQLDPSAYTRILNNLIQNAVQHGQCTSLSIQLKQGEDKVYLEVRNDGEVIPQDKLPYIFERLYCCDEARKDSGNGLGLAIVMELVEVHKGTITATSNEVEGTRFVIVLPK